MLKRKPPLTIGTPTVSRSKPQSSPSAPTEQMITPESKSGRESSKGPIKECRRRSLRATIWKNATEKGVMYNVTLSRMYKDGDQWKDSQSFGFDDLMNLAKLLADAHTCISAFREKDFVAGGGRQSSLIGKSDADGSQV